MKLTIKQTIIVLTCCLLFVGCKELDTTNNNNPDRDGVLSSGADLKTVLNGAYLSWWRAIHGEYPVIALGVTADAYGLAWEDFGAQRMGKEPRTAYNNRSTESNEYQQIAEVPWYGCLSAVSTANDILSALDNGVSIDKDGPLDESIRAAAYLLRGLSWGYLGLIFDQGLIADENTDLNAKIPFVDYKEMIAAAVTELERAIRSAGIAGIDFNHTYFNGVSMDSKQFSDLCHSYAARFLAQWPRTEAEYQTVDWTKVLEHAEQGIRADFGPIADGNFWTSYHRYTFDQTGEGPFWARVDQRLVAAMDPSQPTRYPEVVANGDTPLSSPMASSADERLNTDFVFVQIQHFPADLGEWHYSHYKHNRNRTDPGFAGDGATMGAMPAFLQADNELLEAEALLNLDRLTEAIGVINAGTRIIRGQLPAVDNRALAPEVMLAIQYERAIELFNAAPMGQWFDRRRFAPRLGSQSVDALGGLQMGTPAQLPVPADELKVQGELPYNFGGSLDPEGIERVF